MTEHLILKKDEILWWSWYLSGLWFQRRKNSDKKEVEKIAIETTEKKYTVNENNVFSNFKLATKASANSNVHSLKKKKRQTEWGKTKKSMRYVDVNINPQRLKPRGYNGYDVSNKATDEDDEREIKKYKYEK